jgi:hypothetical protein
MTIRRGVATLALWAAIPGISGAIELQRATIDAWNTYVQAEDARMTGRLADGKPFLWIDEAPDRAARLRRGEVIVAPLVGNGTMAAPGGLIHDWIGAVFIPNGSIAGLLAAVHDYRNYRDIYKPVVVDARPLGCSSDEQEFSMTWQRHVIFINAAMEAQYRAHDYTVNDSRGYNVTDAVRIQEIENFGHASQRLLPRGTGNGFMWRLHSIARYQERDGGLYLELEVTALTRDVPASLRWIVNPIMNHLSVNSLTATLRQTRDAVRATTLQAKAGR